MYALQVEADLAADKDDKQYGGKGIDMTNFPQFTSEPSPKSNSERSQIRKEEITKERLLNFVS
jgi:hypothetical protein